METNAAEQSKIETKKVADDLRAAGFDVFSSGYDSILVRRNKEDRGYTVMSVADARLLLPRADNRAVTEHMRVIYSHRETKALVELTKDENGRVEFCAQGGGFLMVGQSEKFHKEFELAGPLQFKRGTVSADFFINEESGKFTYLPCWSDGSSWNGWGMPYFERATVDRLIKLSEENFLMPLKWSGDGEEVIVLDEDYEGGFYNLPAREINGVKTWDVGSGSWCWDGVVITPTLDETVERMKKEIIADIMAGRVPLSIKEFGDLDNYVDANEYGGFCEDEFGERLDAHFGGRVESGVMPDGEMLYIADAQSAIDKWIKAGGHRTNTTEK
jgi:hypothetical protein